MWKCPSCGKRFESTHQEHTCDMSLVSIDHYIAAQPSQVQMYLTMIRKTIKEQLPETKEIISWDMPTFWDRHNIIHFAAFKNHIGIYPGPEAIEHFHDQLREYKTSKGAWHLPYKEPLPIKLISEMAAWCQKKRLQDR